MSKLNVDEIRNSTDSETTPPSIPGLKPQLAAAWVKFNGVSDTIETSYNVSSVTDLGVGNKSVNFTTPFQDANYASFCGTNSVIIPNVNNVSPSSATARTSNSDGISIDSTQISIVVFSD